MGDVHWTKGFWADKMQICKDSMIPGLWKTYTSVEISHAYKNFQIAAGLDSGSHAGPSFHDGDFYKLIEAVASLYSITKDKKLDEMMDSVITTIAKAQREDGYIYTDALIKQRNTGVKSQFEDRLSFEAYNFGHLMTAACIHFRATGKTTLLDVAVKATDYLYGFYKKASPELARNAICPSHYMGVVEMYRTTGDPRYLELAKHLIDIKGKIEDGSDDNQDRVPFRQQITAMGHAVRANYLYAGVADLYAETGEDSLLYCLDKIWNDVVQHKMYVTGACGALYDGVSPNAVSYDPSKIQQVHQAYGSPYQLPNETAHNETCANIGNLLWNWRMLQITGRAKYADVLELALYNSILSGINLEGTKFFYTNPLRVSDDFPDRLRWSGGRVKYISLSNCCPPNVVRTIAEVSNYAYNISSKGLYVNLYGGNTLSTHLADGSLLKLTQLSNYPLDGIIKITINKVDAGTFSFFLRIPGWCNNASLLVNGKPTDVKLVPGEYAQIYRQWKEGDCLELNLLMKVTLLAANPLVEEIRNQIAVKRGPIVYCIESVDIPAGKKISGVTIPVETRWAGKISKIADNNIIQLRGNIKYFEESGWQHKLYQPVSQKRPELMGLKLIPYYAWANRGKSEMSVWMPVSR
jgi:hypothetical protein